MDKIRVTDYEAVLATITKYTDACKEGKSEIMKPAFTENALMYGYLNGEYYHGSIEALYGAVDAFGAARETYDDEKNSCIIDHNCSCDFARGMLSKAGEQGHRLSSVTVRTALCRRKSDC